MSGANRAGGGTGPLIRLGVPVSSIAPTDAGSTDGSGIDGGTGMPRVITYHPDIRRHLGRPWMDAWIGDWLSEHFGSDRPGNGSPPVRPEPARPATDAAGAAGFGEGSLARHAFFAGSTGSGKTRTYLRVCEQLLHRGHSLVALDPAKETVLHLAEAANRAGVRPEHITLFLPDEAGSGVPGWNPFIADEGDPESAAEEFADVVWSSAERGVQMADTLAYALAPVVAHGLSLVELERLLLDKAYRERLLSLPDPPGHETALYQARTYFKTTYKDAMAASVLNKFSPLLRNRYLRRVVSAERNTVDLDALWGPEQRVVLVHLGGIGSEGVRFLGGSIAWSLYHAAVRSGGPHSRPVTLGVDEIGMADAFLEGAVKTILKVARKSNLRLLLATQVLSDLPASLCDQLLTNTAARAFFRLGDTDARRVAKTLGGKGPVAYGSDLSVRRLPPERIELVPYRETKDGVAMETASYPLFDAYGSPAAIGEGAWRAIERRNAEGSAARMDALAYAESLVPGKRLLAVDPRDRQRAIPIREFLAGLRSDEWRFAGPVLFGVTVRFPLPRVRDARDSWDGGGPRSLPGNVDVSGVGDTWDGILHALPNRQVLLHEPEGGPPVRVAVDDVPLLEPEPRFLRSCLSNGWAWEDAEAAYRDRLSRMDAFVAGLPMGGGGPAQRAPDAEMRRMRPRL